MTSIQSIHIGQIWSVRDHHRGARRHVQVVATTDQVNNPNDAGGRVSVVNVSTGRHSHLQAATLHKYWRREQEPER